MIYIPTNENDPIRQGDIFQNLPNIKYDPQKLVLVESDDIDAIVNWAELPKKSGHQIIANLVTSYGIVVTQDCDTQRDPNIAFFEISPFFDVTGLTPPATGKQEDLDKWWGKSFPDQFRIKGQKYFYLPSDPAFKIEQRMAANFQNIFTVSSEFLHKNLGTLRLGRLNNDADEHFREHLSQYFRRYPYDEWYALTPNEAKIYASSKKEKIELKPWQK